MTIYKIIVPFHIYFQNMLIFILYSLIYLRISNIVRKKDYFQLEYNFHEIDNKAKCFI